jgi:hypothetical protein
MRLNTPSWRPRGRWPTRPRGHRRRVERARCTRPTQGARTPRLATPSGCNRPWRLRPPTRSWISTTPLQRTTVGITRRQRSWPSASSEAVGPHPATLDTDRLDTHQYLSWRKHWPSKPGVAGSSPAGRASLRSFGATAGCARQALAHAATPLRLVARRSSPAGRASLRSFGLQPFIFRVVS